MLLVSEHSRGHLLVGLTRILDRLLAQASVAAPVHLFLSQAKRCWKTYLAGREVDSANGETLRVLRMLASTDPDLELFADQFVQAISGAGRQDQQMFLVCAASHLSVFVMRHGPTGQRAEIESIVGQTFRSRRDAADVLLPAVLP